MIAYRLFWIGFWIMQIALLLKFRPWEHGWEGSFIGLGFTLGFLAVMYGVRVLGKKLDLEKKYSIGEARFNSRTGKVLKPDEPNR